jgi:hypothetical protein
MTFRRSAVGAVALIRGTHDLPAGDPNLDARGLDALLVIPSNHAQLVTLKPPASRDRLPELRCAERAVRQETVRPMSLVGDDLPHNPRADLASREAFEYRGRLGSEGVQAKGCDPKEEQDNPPLPSSEGGIAS